MNAHATARSAPSSSSFAAHPPKSAHASGAPYGQSDTQHIYTHTLHSTSRLSIGAIAHTHTPIIFDNEIIFDSLCQSGNHCASDARNVARNSRRTPSEPNHHHQSRAQATPHHPPALACYSSASRLTAGPYMCMYVVCAHAHEHAARGRPTNIHTLTHSCSQRSEITPNEYKPHAPLGHVIQYIAAMFADAITTIWGHSTLSVGRPVCLSVGRRVAKSRRRNAPTSKMETRSIEKSLAVCTPAER